MKNLELTEIIQWVLKSFMIQRYRICSILRGLLIILRVKVLLHRYSIFAVYIGFHSYIYSVTALYDHLGEYEIQKKVPASNGLCNESVNAS